MAREILGEFGNDIPHPQAPVATNGGKQMPRDVNNYQPPVGPSTINNPQTPGLHGDNHGNCGTQGRR